MFETSGSIILELLLTEGARQFVRVLVTAVYEVHQCLSALKV